MKRIILPIVLSFFLPVISNAADIISGMDLLHQFHGSYYSKQLFYGYVGGFLDGYIGGEINVVLKWNVDNSDVAKKLSKPPKEDICIEQSLSYEQIGLIVIKYLNDNPKKLNRPAAILIREALEQAFPCK